MKATNVDIPPNPSKATLLEERQSMPARPFLGRAPEAFMRLVFREDRFFLVLSVFIGIFAGLSGVCFRFAIDWCRIYLLGSGATLSTARLLLAPSLTGLVIAVLVIHVFPLARGSGVNQTKAALYIYNGYIPLRTAVGKFITAAPAIGSGHSLGPEDPSLQIGASLASALGRRMRLSRDRMRLIAPVGAAAGLAAALHAAISGSGIDFSHSAGSIGAAVGADRIFDPRCGGRIGVGRVFVGHCSAAAAV